MLATTGPSVNRRSSPEISSVVKEQSSVLSWLDIELTNLATRLLYFGDLLWPFRAFRNRPGVTARSKKSFVNVEGSFNQ